MASSLSKKLRKQLERLADSRVITGSLVSFAARYLRRTYDRIDWTIEGREELQAEVASGQPVIMALWHGRLMCSTHVWDPAWGRLVSLTSTARPGRIAGQIQTRFGLETLPMHDRKSNRAVSLKLARTVRDGASLGFAVDGPEGPAHLAKTVPIDWSRLTGAPIWLVTFSCENYRLLGSWDRLMVPKRGGRGVILYQRWESGLPKKPTADEIEAARARLDADLDALTLRADQAVGHAKMVN